MRACPWDASWNFKLTGFRAATVLVVEYGDFDDSWNTAIPYYANFLQDASLMFAQPSTPQRYLGNRTFSLPLGATVGGGTTVNGLAVTRGQKSDYDAWEELGNSGWGWEGILKYFRKVGRYYCHQKVFLRTRRTNRPQSTTLHEPSEEVKARNRYKYSTDGFGNGPWEAIFPTFQWPDVCMSRPTARGEEAC